MTPPCFLEWYISPQVLNGMDITRADIPRQGLVSLCPNVVDLDLANNLLETWSELLSILSHLPKVRYLNVSRNRMHLDLTHTVSNLHYFSCLQLLLHFLFYFFFKMLIITICCFIDMILVTFLPSNSLFFTFLVQLSLQCCFLYFWYFCSTASSHSSPSAACAFLL